MPAPLPLPVRLGRRLYPRAPYPVVGNLSRLAAFPELQHTGRRYTRRWEQPHWNLARVYDFLAGFIVPRKV